jgi:hypothetical protein
MKIALIIAAAALLAACGSTARPEPEIRTVEVKTPVAVSCVPKGLPRPPEGLETRESLAAVSTPEERLQRLGADWLRRVARAELVEPVIAICERAAAP